MGKNPEPLPPGILTTFALVGLIFSTLTFAVLAAVALAFLNNGPFRIPIDSQIAWAFVLSLVLGLLLFQGTFRILRDRWSGIILIRIWACLSIAYDLASIGNPALIWLSTVFGLAFAALFLIVTFFPAVGEFFRSAPTGKPKTAEPWSHEAF